MSNVGKTGLMTVRPANSDIIFSFPVRVLNEKTTYGRERLLVTPASPIEERTAEELRHIEERNQGWVSADKVDLTQ